MDYHIEHIGNEGQEQDVTPAAVDSVPAELITGARMAAFTHHNATGQPITADALAEHLGINRPVAAAVLHHLNGTAIPHGGRA